MIPQSFIEEVKQKIRIEEIIAEFTELKQVGKGLKGTCPFHHDSNSFNVSTFKKIFKCFSCQRGGDSITFIKMIKKLTYPQAIAYLAEKLNMVLPSSSE